MRFPTIKHICKLSFSSQRGVCNHNNPFWTRYNEIYTCMRTRCCYMIELIRCRRKELQPRAHAPETRWRPNKKRHRMTPHILQPRSLADCPSQFPYRVSITVPMNPKMSRPGCIIFAYIFILSWPGPRGTDGISVP